MSALSLLREEDEAYFRQHPLLADFAHGQLLQVDEAYAHMADDYQAFAQENNRSYSALQPEWVNIIGVIVANHRLRNREKVIAFTDALSQAWLTRGRYSEARQVHALAQ